MCHFKVGLILWNISSSFTRVLLLMCDVLVGLRVYLNLWTSLSVGPIYRYNLCHPEIVNIGRFKRRVVSHSRTLVSLSEGGDTLRWPILEPYIKDSVVIWLERKKRLVRGQSLYRDFTRLTTNKTNVSLFLYLPSSISLFYLYHGLSINFVADGLLALFFQIIKGFSLFRLSIYS